MKEAEVQKSYRENTTSLEKIIFNLKTSITNYERTFQIWKEKQRSLLKAFELRLEILKGIIERQEGLIVNLKESLKNLKDEVRKRRIRIVFLVIGCVSIGILTGWGFSKIIRR